MGLNSESVLAKIEDAKRHGLLHLSHSNLQRCPPQIFALSMTLLRLDLSANLIETVPDSIASLASLHFLWLSDNPRLHSLPPALAQCAQLRVLDVRATEMYSLPCEFARLSQLVVLDIGDTPLELKWVAKGHLAAAASATKSPFAQDAQRERCERILSKLMYKAERTTLKRELHDKLHDDMYRVERSDASTDDCLKRTIQRLMKLFPVANEMRSVLRNAERLFPSPTVGSSLSEALEKLDGALFRDKFVKLKTDNERKQRAADLELKIRALYFDRVDPRLVEPMVQSIYTHVRELNDINFLVKHAAELFPKDAKDVDGKDILRRVGALQQEIARERQAAVDKLLAAAKAIYGDTEPGQVQRLVASVATLFKSTKDLRSLAADATVLFPAEFLNAQAAEIRAAFVQQKSKMLGASGTTASAMGTSARRTATTRAKR